MSRNFLSQIQSLRSRLLILILCSSLGSFAQINNSFLEDSLNTVQVQNQNLSFFVYNNGYFKNNEFFHNIAQGYTLFGNQCKAGLSYQPNEYVRLLAGVYARKDFGNDGFKTLAPIVSMTVQKNGYSATMGNLDGNVAHRLFEPLYDYERFILHPLEQGIQIKIDKKKIWADMWMNWEVQQYLNDTEQEQFSAGLSADVLLHQKKEHRFSIPIQLVVAHKGGQIDIDSTPLKTISNGGVGFRYTYRSASAQSFIRSVTADVFGSFYKDLSPTKLQNFDEGNGYYITSNILSRYLIGASCGFWSGKKYLSSRGAYLFQSEASQYGTKGYTENRRDLLFLRLYYQQKVFDAIHIDVRFEPYYDLGNSFLEYSYAVYFTYRGSFRLNKR